MLESLLLRDRERASLWCEQNLIFPRETSPNNPGPLSFDRQPYLREIVDCALDATVENVYVAGGSQIGKTAMLICILATFMELEPSDGIWAMVNQDQVRDFSERRVMEFIKANPCLRRHLLAYDTSAFKPMNYRLDNMNVKFVGVGSPANLASTSVAWVIGDEAAKYPWIHKEEAPPIPLLMNRTKAFPRRFHIFTSTPTTIENEFWQKFLTSDMREYFMPCPYCEGEFAFVFNAENVKWDKGTDGHTDLDVAEATARYICPHCKGEIRNEQKFDMMAKGRWLPSEALRREYADDRIKPSSGTRGYHITSMYSPYLTFGNYVRQFLECLQNLTVATDLQDLRNSWEALPYEFTRITIKSENVLALCGDYVRGTLPLPEEQIYYVSVAYDPGGDETHWVACAVSEGGAMYVIDWGTILQPLTEGHYENDGSEEEPEWRWVIDKPGVAPHFAGLEWLGVKPGIGFVDAGYMTKEMYDECLRLPGQLTPTKGSPSKVGTWWTRPAGPTWPGLEVLSYVDYMAKMSLYSETIAKQRAPKLVLPRAEDVDSDLVRGLSGQKLVNRNGRQQWKKVEDDHYGDCIKLQRVGWWCLGRRFEDAAALPLAKEAEEADGYAGYGGEAAPITL